MAPVSRSHFGFVHLAAASLVATALLLGCLDANKQTETAADDRDDGRSEVERAVIERSQARWKSLLEGDIESAYAYTSPAFRSSTPLHRFRVQSGSAIQWEDAEAQSAQCDGQRCRVTVELTYRLAREGITHTRPISETWILSENEWWIHTSR